MSVDIRGLAITIGGKSIVSQVDMTIGEGQKVGLIGSSGSGKSMITRAMLGLLPADAQVSGSIRYQNSEVLDSPERTLAHLRGRYVSTVFQDPHTSLNPVNTVEQQMALPLRLHYDLTGDETRERVMSMLDRVGLDWKLAASYPSQLSGGQQQRVAIATALITAPKLLIADEPTTALDSLTQRHIVDLLGTLVSESGTSMLFITHDFSVLSRATEYVYVMDQGRIVESGSVGSLLDNPKALETRRLAQAAMSLSLKH